MTWLVHAAATLADIAVLQLSASIEGYVRVVLMLGAAKAA
jgi:hypothetical protein